MKILELSAQLEDARRGLRETQNALMDVQHAAEVLTQNVTKETHNSKRFLWKTRLSRQNFRTGYGN